MSSKRISVIERIMGANDTLALRNRETLDAHHIHAINVMASPGAGKTTLLIETAKRLAGKMRMAVVEGDVASQIDADKVRAAGIPAVQINTGGGCHLDANQVRDGLSQLDLDGIDLLFVENVGNLICPVGFALGEHTRVALTSVPEGDDKPHKYPGIFANVDTLVISKTDLLPWVAFDVAKFRRLVEGLNPAIRIFEISCVDGTGLDEWIEWLIDLTDAQ